MFGVLWQCVCVFFGVHVFLSLKCLRMCVLYIVSTRVYAVFNCVCITQSSVCSVCMYHMQLRPEADGCWQPITTEGPLSAYSSSSSSLFIDPYAGCLANSVPFLH